MAAEYDDTSIASWKNISDLWKSNHEFRKKFEELYKDYYLQHYTRCLFSDWFEQKWVGVKTECSSQMETAAGLFTELLQRCVEHPSNTNNSYHQMIISHLKEKSKDPKQFVDTVIWLLREETKLVERYTKSGMCEGRSNDSYNGIEEPNQMQCESGGCEDSSNNSHAGIEDLERMKTKLKTILQYQKKESEDKIKYQEEIDETQVRIENAKISLASLPDINNGIGDVISESENNIHIRECRITDIDENIKTYMQKLETLVVAIRGKSEEVCSDLMERLIKWKRDRQLQYVGLKEINSSTSISPLDKWCGKFGQISFELIKAIFELSAYPESLQIELKEVKEAFVGQLSTLFKSSFIVTDQVEYQVRVSNLKKGTGNLKCPKFKATLRLLGADLIEHLSESYVTADFSLEKDVIDGASQTASTKLVGDKVLLKKTTSKRVAKFENLELKEFVRTEPKVCEVRYRLVFTTNLDLLGICLKLQTVSLPIVVVTGNMNLQGNDALCGITWQCFMSKDAFAIPVESVTSASWSKVSEMLDLKLNCMCGRGLKPDHLLHLAFLITDKTLPDYSAEQITIKQLIEKKRTYTDKDTDSHKMYSIWTWFTSICNLIEKYLKLYWQKGLIEGFISKKNVVMKLTDEDTPVNTFIMRFCDTVPDGALSISLSVMSGKSKSCKHVNPFRVEALEYEGLANLIRDRFHHIGCHRLYPGELTVQEAFKDFQERPGKVERPVTDYLYMKTVQCLSELKINKQDIQETQKESLISSERNPKLPKTLQNAEDQTRTAVPKLEAKRHLGALLTDSHSKQRKISNEAEGKCYQVNKVQYSGGSVQINDRTGEHEEAILYNRPMEMTNNISYRNDSQSVASTEQVIEDNDVGMDSSAFNDSDRRNSDTDVDLDPNELQVLGDDILDVIMPDNQDLMLNFDLAGFGDFGSFSSQ